MSLKLEAKLRVNICDVVWESVDETVKLARDSRNRENMLPRLCILFYDTKENPKGRAARLCRLPRLFVRLSV
jgi:hypothetical protein